jgi:hypothetical protein
MARSSECTEQYAQKVLDTADIVRDAWYRQVCYSGEVSMESHDLDDPGAMYIREVGGVKPLAKDEETKLFRELDGTGDWDDARGNVARRWALIEQGLFVKHRHSVTSFH